MGILTTNKGAKMKSHKIKIIFNNGTIKIFQRTSKKIQKYKNVNILVFTLFKETTIKKILVTSFNKHTKKNYWNLTFDSKLENYLKNHYRLKSTNKKGWEDLSYYGGKSNGKHNYFYIEKSTGWIPIYLSIANNNSTGGGALCLKGIKRLDIINY
jgi:hypothetical protein